MNSELLAESMSKKFELQAPHLQELTVAAYFITLLCSLLRQRLAQTFLDFFWLTYR